MGTSDQVLQNGCKPHLSGSPGSSPDTHVAEDLGAETLASISKTGHQPVSGPAMPSFSRLQICGHCAPRILLSSHRVLPSCLSLSNLVSVPGNQALNLRPCLPDLPGWPLCTPGGLCMQEGGLVPNQYGICLKKFGLGQGQKTFLPLQFPSVQVLRDT